MKKLSYFFLILTSMNNYSQTYDSTKSLNCDNTFEFYKSFFEITIKDEFETTDDYIARVSKSIKFPINKCFCSDIMTSDYNADKQEYELKLFDKKMGTLYSSPGKTYITIDNFEIDSEWGEYPFYNNQEDSRIAKCQLMTFQNLVEFINRDGISLAYQDPDDEIGYRYLRELKYFVRIPISKAKDAKGNLSMKINCMISSFQDREEYLHSISSLNPFLGFMNYEDRQQELMRQTIDYVISAEIMSITFYNRLTKEIYTEYKPE
jgi:hypothetical protein